MEATAPASERPTSEPLNVKAIRRARLAYRSHLADAVDVLLALGDSPGFARAWRSVSASLSWNHRPSARRLWELARLPMEGEIVEIGSYMGNSTVFLALAAGQVHAVDPHSAESMTQVPWHETNPDHASGAGDPSLAFLSNLERFGVGDLVVYHRMESVAAARSWSGEPVRLLYIDGLHTFEAVSEDYRAWRRWLAEDHVVLFDDFLWKPVEHAVRELRRSFRPAHFYIRGGQAIFSSRPLSLRVAGFP